MDIYLIQGKNRLALPVLPSEYTMQGSQNNTSENVSKIGEVNILGKRNLKTISLSSIFPFQEYDFCNYSDIPKPQKCVSIVENMKKNGTLRLVMTGQKNINMVCTIEEFEWGENDGTRDIQFTINFKEYRLTGDKRYTKNTKRKTIIYKCKKGDTLQKVAKKQTGDSKNWKKIKKQNKLKSNKLKAGQKLVITK